MLARLGASTQGLPPWLWFSWNLTHGQITKVFPGVAQRVRNPLAMQDTQFWSLGWADPLEKGMATHSRILSWRILRTEEPGGLQSTRSHWVTEWLAHTLDHQAFSPLFLGICNHTTLLFGEGHFLPLPMPMKCQLARALYSGKSPRRKSKNQGKECSEYFSCRHASPGWSKMGCLIRGPRDSQCSVSCFFSLGRRTL